MRRPYPLLVAGCIVLGLAAGAAAREKVPALGRLRFEGRASPTIYVRYKDQQLWVGSSFEELRTARPLPLKWTKTWSYEEEDVHFRWRRYAEVRLTGRVGRFSEVRMRPVVSIGLAKAPKPGEREPEPRGDEVLLPEFHFLYRDESGTLWDYVSGSECLLTRTTAPAKARLVEIRALDPAQLRLVIEPSRGRGAVGILVRAKAGRAEVANLRRDGKGLPVHVVVKSAEGKVVHSEVGDLRRFAPRVTDCYCARIPKGTYTVSATIDRTPFSEPLTVSRQMEVK